MDVAGRMLGPVIFGFFVGHFLDKQFHLFPALTLILTMLGVATGIWSVIKQAYYK